LLRLTGGATVACLKFGLSLTLRLLKQQIFGHSRRVKRRSIRKW
jgi:hypothetical protein